MSRPYLHQHLPFSISLFVWKPTAALRSSSFQKLWSRIQLTSKTEVSSCCRAVDAIRAVSQFALQLSVLVRRMRDCSGGRAR